MLEEFTPDCCIATCRVLGQVFECFGYYAEAVPVTTYIFNAQMAELLTSGVQIPTEPAARKEFLDSTGAWSVGITRKSAEAGPKVVGGRYGGHLVLRVTNTLIDASLQQADRPHYGIVLPNGKSVVIVVFHDDALDRMSKNDPAIVEGTFLAQLRQLPAANNNRVSTAHRFHVLL